MNWTDVRVDLLKKLWSDGLSASLIAAELGGISRSSVIGKVHRLGLAGRKNNTSTRFSPRPRKPRIKPMMRVARPEIYSAPPKTWSAPVHDHGVEDANEPALVETIIPIGQRRSLMELNDCTCRWPIGNPCSEDFFFCGGKTIDGKLGIGHDISDIPYCGYHSRIAYKPVADYRREKRATKEAGLIQYT